MLPAPRTPHPNLHFSTTTTTTPSISSTMSARPFGLGGSLAHPSPIPAPSLQPSWHSFVSSDILQQPTQQVPAGYPVGRPPSLPQMNRYYAERRRVDDRRSPNRLSVEQQQQQQQQQARWYGSGTQQMAQLPQLFYRHTPTYVPPSHVHFTHTHTPTQSSSISTVPVPTLPAPPRWTNGSSNQGQGLYYYGLGPTPYVHPAQVQAYHRQPSSLPEHPPPANAFFPANEPSSYAPPPLTQTNLTAPGDTPSSGAAPEVNMPGMSSDLPWTRPNQSDGRYERQESQPSQRPIPPAARKTRPIAYEGNLVLLQQRCKKQGADNGAIALLGKIFANGVSLEALMHTLTDENEEFGIEMGRAYTVLLESTNVGESVISRYTCRLCHSDLTWKHAKDVLRHLKRAHFGFADDCKNWYVFNYSPTVASVHVLPWIPAVGSSSPKAS
jgi:hypothetical protein